MPENEKSIPFTTYGRSTYSPPSACASTFGPPGCVQPTWRVNLSIAFPTPVSIVSPSTR